MFSLCEEPTNIIMMGKIWDANVEEQWWINCIKKEFIIGLKDEDLFN